MVVVYGGICVEMRGSFETVVHHTVVGWMWGRLCVIVWWMRVVVGWTTVDVECLRGWLCRDVWSSCWLHVFYHYVGGYARHILVDDVDGA